MKKLVLLTIALLFIGCSETPVLYDNSNYKGEPIQVADNIYFKKVKIQGLHVLLQCDKDGRIIHNQNISVGYQSGKVYNNVSVLTPVNETEVKSDINFLFKCVDINDCYNQVLVVKNSILK